MKYFFEHDRKTQKTNFYIGFGAVLIIYFFGKSIDIENVFSPLIWMFHVIIIVYSIFSLNRTKRLGKNLLSIEIDKPYITFKVQNSFVDKYRYVKDQFKIEHFENSLNFFDLNNKIIGTCKRSLLIEQSNWNSLIDELKDFD